MGPGECCVVLLSGGLDSAVTLAIAVREHGGQAHCLTFDYGQRHRVEIDLAARLARALGATAQRVVQVDRSVVAGSALTGGGAVPRGGPGQGMPATYVPARNTLLLAHGLAEAERIGASALYIGANVVDYSGYPDCRPEFLAAFERLAALATRAAVEEGKAVRVLAPLIDLRKADIVRRGAALGVDFALTSSCYDPGPAGAPCRECEACRLRARGFAGAGLSDPAVGPAPA